jgi:hypothetical protein
MSIATRCESTGPASASPLAVAEALAVGEALAVAEALADARLPGGCGPNPSV